MISCMFVSHILLLIKQILSQNQIRNCWFCRNNEKLGHATHHQSGDIDLPSYIVGFLHQCVQKKILHAAIINSIVIINSIDVTLFSTRDVIVQAQNDLAVKEAR